MSPAGEEKPKGFIPKNVFRSPPEKQVIGEGWVAGLSYAVRTNGATGYGDKKGGVSDFWGR